MNKFNFFIGLIGVVLLSSCGSSPYKVERSIEINTPATEPYNQVINHRNRVNWSPWEAKDPEMTKEFEGPESGVGSIQKWSGNDEVGTGSLEITEATPYSSIKNKLIFTEPWEAEDNVEWTFVENEGVTTATWSSSGEMPTMMSWFVDLEEEIGPDFESGLASLKAYCEENYSAPVVEMPADTSATDSLMIEEVEEEM